MKKSVPDHAQTAFKRFVVGALIFVSGLIAILWSEFQLPPSLTQEALALLGMIALVPGAVLAAWGYGTLLWIRLFSPRRPDKPHD